VTTVALLVAVLLVTAGCEPRRSLTGWLPYWSTSSATAGVSANSDLFAELSPFWFRATGTTTFANDATTSDQAKVVALARSRNLPLVPSVPEERFEQAIDLEWPIDGLEPLSFVLGRLMDPLSAHLERRDRGAAVLHVRLHLVSKAVHERSLELPAPMRDARTLRTLVLLDLESHPPDAAIDRVVVAVDPTPARILQYSLLTRPLPSPEQVSTLMARLNALMGEGRCGAPQTVDSWRPGAFNMAPFAPVEAPSGGREGGDGREGGEGREGKALVVALRRFRFAVPARVQIEDGRPVRVTTERRGIDGGRIDKAAGPWRTSGQWWAEPSGAGGAESPWDRDEWDVTVSDGATYRLYRERDANAWFIDGVLD